MEDRLATLTASDEYRELLHQRHRIVWPLLWLTVLTYFAFVLLIAFAPASLGVPIVKGGVISVGIILGLALIVLNFLVTWLYVRAANRHIEPLIAKLHSKGVV